MIRSNKSSRTSDTSGERRNGEGRQPVRRYTITELAAETNVTPRAIDHYERKGFIRSKMIGGRRVYSAADKEKVEAICKGRKLGFLLDEIIAMVRQRGGRKPDLVLGKRAILRQIEQLELRRTEIDKALEELRTMEQMLDPPPPPVARSRDAQAAEPDEPGGDARP